MYHYTGMSSFCGIVESAALWATDARFCNDHSEIEYAYGLLKEMKEEALAPLPQEGQEIAGSAVYRILTNHFDWHPFVACFCASRDLLSQWRGYGMNEPGVAVGLDLSEPCFTRGDSLRPVLRRVIYEAELQRSLIVGLFQAWYDQFELASVEERDHGGYDLEVELQQLCVYMKHPTFREEQEWRLISSVHDIDDGQRALVRHRPSRMGLTPYVVLNATESESREDFDGDMPRGALPLREVLLSPDISNDNAADSALSYLLNNGYSVGVRSSQIPLR